MVRNGVPSARNGGILRGWEMTDYYIVSVKHTLRNNKYITIWRPDDRGYCWALCNAGKYPHDLVMNRLSYYNTGHSDVAVPCAVLDAIAVPPIKGHHDFDAGPCIENKRNNWRLILSNVIADPMNEPHPQFRGAPRLRDAA